MRARKEKPRHKDDKPAEQMTQEEKQYGLLRALVMAADRWRECPARACRRARRCAHPAIPCRKLPRRRVLTPQNDAGMRAHLYKMVKRRMEEIEQERAVRALPSARPKATPGGAAGGSDRPSAACK